MKFAFVLTFFCFILLSGKTTAMGGLLTPSLRKSLEPETERKLVDEKKLNFMKSVFGQFLLYLGVNLGVPVTEEENTADGLKMLDYEGKLTELKEQVFKYVNVVEGVEFNDEKCKYTFSSSQANMTEASDTCEGEATIADLGDKSPLDYVVEKVGASEEFLPNKYVFLLGKGEGADMEVLLAIEIQPFKVLKKPDQKPVKEAELEVDQDAGGQSNSQEDQEEIIERKLKKDEDPEIELIIRIMNSVAESRLKVQYAEQTVPSTNNFLNNVVTSFMLKNDQLVFNLKELKEDIVKMLVYNFTADSVDDFSVDDYQLKKGEDLRVTSEHIKSPGEIDRLGFEPIKFHVNYLDLKAGGARVLADSDYFQAHGTKAIEGHPEGEEMSSADEQLLFLLTPSYMNVSPIYIIVTRKGMSLRVVFHSSYFQSTEYFSFAARPFVVKTIERRVKKMANKILRPISILEHQSGDENFDADHANKSQAYLFANTLIKELHAYHKEEALDGLAEDDKVTDVEQFFIRVITAAEIMELAGDSGDPNEKFKEECEKAEAEKGAIMCITLMETDFAEGSNMFEVLVAVLKPDHVEFKKRYPIKSLYDMGLFTKSFARYLVDLTSSITSTPENAIKTTLYKNSFPPFEPTMSGIVTTFITNDIFEINEAGAEPLSVRSDLKMKLIAPPDDGQKTKTVAYEYVSPAKEPSRFAEYLKA